MSWLQIVGLGAFLPVEHHEEHITTTRAPHMSLYSKEMRWWAVRSMEKPNSTLNHALAQPRLILLFLVALARRAIFDWEPAGVADLYISGLNSWPMLRPMFLYWANAHAGSYRSCFFQLCIAVDLIAKVYRQAFWLGLLEAKTPKRLIAWSNDRLISALDLGKLCRENKKTMDEKLDGEKTTQYWS